MKTFPKYYLATVANATSQAVRALTYVQHAHEGFASVAISLSNAGFEVTQMTELTEAQFYAPNNAPIVLRGRNPQGCLTVNNSKRDEIASLAYTAGTLAKRAADKIEHAIMTDATPAQLPRLRHERTRLLAMFKKLGESGEAISRL